MKATAAASRLWGFGVVALLIILGPVVVYPVLLMKVMCFALFAAGFNLLLGFGGLLSFGHAAYFGIGSYVSAYAAKAWGWPPEAAVTAGTAAGALLGVIFGVVAIRRQGIYFAMITLALAQLIYFVCLQVPFTGGEDGLQSVPRGKLLGLVDLSNDLTLYGVVSVVFFLTLLLVSRIVHSPFGHVLRAIRDNEARAISLGYKTVWYRLAVFVLSTVVCALAGAMKAIVFQLASLTDVHWTTSGEVVLMTLVGGMGTLFGPLVGAAVVVAAEFYLASIGSWVQVIEGGIFVACVLGFRAGIVGTLADFGRRSIAARQGASARAAVN
ncbi:branched-chain amino acid ABC transporter permease [Hyphomicrobiales bacterium BP6-180914]|uniref:Branched-chain amino acid ABC transporter permease n=1 Tax=Lichenifustis flavocetrariae TaxID=2949735 RepID=A0AA41Z2Z9_9HYPH|nr:branched-chain amino acid ABC transporter permease [Lichenifustis flavocetrariae]MCW6508352.1 branched-chain amino acid ABC transporter permease [Lichenifustis flavocetrariae]